MKRKYEKITPVERRRAEDWLFFGGGFSYEVYAKKVFGSATDGERARIARVARKINRGVMAWRRGESEDARRFLRKFVARKDASDRETV